MKRSLLPIFALAISPNLHAQNPINNTSPEQIIEYEKRIADNFCKDIYKDEKWLALASNIKSFDNIFEKFPKSDNETDAFTEANSIINSLIDASYNDFSRRVEEGQPFVEYIRDHGPLHYTRPLRIIQACGDKLFDDGIIAINPRFKLDQNAANRMSAARSKIEEYASCISEYDRDFITHYNAAKSAESAEEKDGAIRALTSSLRNGCPSYGQQLQNTLLFPYDRIPIEGAPDTAYMRTDNVIQESIAKAPGIISELNGKIASHVEIANLDALKKERITQVRDGNISLAESCKDFADALIEPQDISTELFGYVISKDGYNVYQEPTQKIYSLVSNVASANDSQIIIYDTKSFSGESYGAVLNIDSYTRFFGRMPTQGSKIFFVAKYTGNNTLNFEDGTQTPARDYLTLCISTI